jgi:hypothetical protein
VNLFWHLFQRARDFLDEHPQLSSLHLIPQLRLINHGDDPCRFNLPTVNYNLAAIMPDIPSEFEQRSYREVILYHRHAPDVVDGITAGTGRERLMQIYPNHCTLPATSLCMCSSTRQSWVPQGASADWIYRCRCQLQEDDYITLYVLPLPPAPPR